MVVSNWWRFFNSCNGNYGNLFIALMNSQMILTVSNTTEVESISADAAALIKSEPSGGRARLGVFYSE